MTQGCTKAMLETKAAKFLDELSLVILNNLTILKHGEKGAETLVSTVVNYVSEHIKWEEDGLAMPIEEIEAVTKFYATTDYSGKEDK